MCQHLSFIGFGKATGGKAKVRTGLGKSDCPGSQGGLWKRVKKRAPYFYPDGAADKAVSFAGCESPYRQLPDSGG